MPATPGGGPGRVLSTSTRAVNHNRAAYKRSTEATAQDGAGIRGRSAGALALTRASGPPPGSRAAAREPRGQIMTPDE